MIILILKKIRDRRWINVIRKSGMFDAAYYLKEYKEVIDTDMDPIKHYVLIGWKQGKNPNEFFNTQNYLDANKDVKASVINPFAHYIIYVLHEVQLPAISRFIGSIKNNGILETLYKLYGKLMARVFIFYSKLKLNNKNQDNNESLISYVDYRDYPHVSGAPKIVAFYLPQFHPFPENDEWWGKGFTEWTNVSKAKPVFNGHYQPHLPIHLGFYDLRIVENLYEQARLAKNYSISGFNFYYYWFDGKVLMEKPLKLFLENKGIDIEFCLTWANENWTRRWDGRENEILIKQNHSLQDSKLFLESLFKFFDDNRYIKIDGKPVLIIYRANIIPFMQDIIAQWRLQMKDNGYPGIYLVCAQTFGVLDPADYGFDAAMEFPPHTVKRKDVVHKVVLNRSDFSGNIFDYKYIVEHELKKTEPDYKLFRTCMLSWDNTARRENSSNIFYGFDLNSYKTWLTHLLQENWNNPKYSNDEKIVFVNAWNEWAEGTHLEPDRRFGYGYLDTTRAAFDDIRKNDSQNLGKKRLYIHIGLPKTGTSAIQNYLVTNYDLLKDKHNLFYPKLGRAGDGSHHNIAWALSANPYKELLDDAKQRELLIELRNEIDSSTCSSALLSSECFAMHSNKAFKEIIASNYELHIICYLRRQDDYIESSYSQIVKDVVRKETRSFTEYLNDSLSSLSYFEMLQKWEGIAEKENIHIREYDKNSFLNGSIVDDFLSIIGVRLQSSKVIDTKKQLINLSLTPKLTLFKRLLNKAVKTQDQGLVNLFHSYMQSNPSTESSLLTSSQRKYIFDYFLEDNTKVAKHYFPDRKTLFAESKIINKEYASLSNKDISELLLFLKKNKPTFFQEVIKNIEAIDSSDKEYNNFCEIAVLISRD